MFIVISHLNPDPMYKQVTDQIKNAVAEGAIKPEDKLPSIREMSKILKISPITIKRAYADLENEGYIITRSGLGSYVADIDKEKLRLEKFQEIREEISRLLSMADKFQITAEDFIRMIKDLGGRK